MYVRSPVHEVTTQPQATQTQIVFYSQSTVTLPYRFSIELRFDVNFNFTSACHFTQPDISSYQLFL